MRELIPPPITLAILGLAYAVYFGLEQKIVEKGVVKDPFELSLKREEILVAKSKEFSLGRPHNKAVNAIIARPLFSPTRRIPVPEAPTPEVVPTPTPVSNSVIEPEPEPLKPELRARFLGIISENEQFNALLEVEGQQTWVKKGEVFDGWKIFEIDGQKVTLRYKEQVLSIPIER